MEERQLKNIFYALSDSIRLKILRLVLEYKEVCVCSFMAYFNMSQPRISFHLRVLRQAGILKAKKRGQWSYYSLNENNEIIKLVKDIIMNSISLEQREVYCEI